MNEDVILKILIIGDTEVGKTSLLLQYTEGYFPEDFISTIGVEFKMKKLKIKDMDINLQIWDTAGQERFKSITKNFFKDANGIIFMYDITKKDSYENVKNWIKDSENYTKKDIKIIVAGNKIDLESKRQVQREALDKYCNIKKIPGDEISAKLGIKVNDIFETLANLIVKDMTKNEIIEKFKRVDGSRKLGKKNKNKKKKKFC